MFGWSRTNDLRRLKPAISWLIGPILPHTLGRSTMTKGIMTKATVNALRLFSMAMGANLVRQQRLAVFTQGSVGEQVLYEQHIKY